MNKDDQITYFAETDFRNKRTRFGIKAKDRTRHVYTIGKTGMGKSTMLENMAIQDIQNGNGIAFLDPHGSTADKLLSYVPESRIKDVIYFAPFDLDYPVSFNVMEDVGPDKRHLVAAGLMSAFKKIWVDAWSARMEYILNNTILALLEYPGSTIISINRMLADKDYRKLVVDNVTDPAVKSFWIDEFGKYTEKFAAEATPAIQNKIGQFISNPLIRNIIGQPKSSFDVRSIMDGSKILIMNLSKGRLGEGNANLLGSMLITKIYLGAMSRADVPASIMKTLPKFYFFVDEFQNFANESFAGILSEARKYHLNLTIAHQYIEQMTEEVRAAVFGNVGTMISFRVGAYDADVLEKEFAPIFTAEDIVNLGFTQVYMKLMVDGIGSKPFSARTLDTPPLPEPNFVEEIIENSRKMYAMPRREVEENIKKWHESTGDKSGNNQPKSQSNGSSQNNGNFKSQNKFGDRDNRDRNSAPRPHFENGNGSRDRFQNKPKPIQEPHKPFQTALKTMFEPANQNKDLKDSEEDRLKREQDLRGALSLSFIKKRSEDEEREKIQKERVESAKKISKLPTEENLSALRSALKDVLKESLPNIGQTNNIQKEEKKPEQMQPKPIQQTYKPEPKGVSEEELRAILHVDEPES